MQGTIGPGASLLGAGSVPGLEIPTPTATLAGSADDIWDLTCSLPALRSWLGASRVRSCSTSGRSTRTTIHHIAKTLAGAAASWR